MLFQRLREALRLKNLPRPERSRLYLTQKLFLSSSAKPISDDANGRSLTASYLVSSLGLSSESAVATTRSVRAVNPKQAAEAIHSLEEQGFTLPQIADIVSRYPRALSLVSLKTILPKIEFLMSRGASSANVASLIRRSPRFLDRSLERHIVPSFEMISCFLESDSQAILTMTRCAGIWFLGTASVFAMNRRALAAAGVPDNNVRCLLRRQPNCLLTSRAKFDHALEKVKSIGVDPLHWRFLMSMIVIINLAESTWKKKVELFGRWGWSKEDTLRAFKKHPACMLLSEKKLTEIMEFFINEMELESSYFIRNPLLLSLSLRNRIVPRCLVIQELISKKLIKKFSLNTVLMTTEMCFTEKYISPYSAKHPGVLSLYQEKLGKGESLTWKSDH